MKPADVAPRASLRPAVVLAWAAIALQTAPVVPGGASTADAAGFYVSTDGSDRDRGSIDRPWRTIQVAANRLGAGDTLYIRGGTYYQRTTLTASGVAGSPIVIRSYPGERAVLDSGTPRFRVVGNDDWELVDASLGEYRSLESFPSEKIYAYVSGIPGYRNERVVLVPYARSGDFRATTDEYGSDSLYVGPGTFWDSGRIHIRLGKTRALRDAEARYGPVFDADLPDPRRYSIVLSQARTTLTVSGAHLVFQDLTFHQALNTVELAPSAHEVVFDGITVWLGDSSLEIRGAHHVTVTRSKIYGDHPAWIFWSDMKNHPRPADRLRATSIDINSGAHDVEISYCHIRGSCQDLIGTAHSERDLVFHHNRIENAGDDAFELEGATDVGRVEIYDNYILNTLTAVAPGQDTPSFTGPLLVYRNVIALLRNPPVNRREGINSWNGGHRFGFEYMFKQEVESYTTRNAHYYHNTLVMLNSRVGLNLTPKDPTDCRIANNIAVAVSGNVNRDFRFGPRLVLDGNLYWKLNGGDGSLLLSRHRTVAEFRAATGFEAHGLGDSPGRGTDPQLASFAIEVIDPSRERWEIEPASETPALTDFLPSGMSPAIGAGIEIPPHPELGEMPGARASRDIGALPYGAARELYEIFPFVPDADQGEIDRVPPSVAIDSPEDGDSVSGTVMVSVSARDRAGVTAVELYLDRALLGIAERASHDFSWNTATVSDGPHVLEARAYDSAGNVGTSVPVSVIVANDGVAPAAPILRLPRDGSTHLDVPIFNWSTLGDAIGLSYELELDGDPDFSSPEVAARDLIGLHHRPVGLAPGTYLWRVRAVDRRGRQGPWSQAWSVTLCGAVTGPLVGRQSLWRYHDLGQDLGTAWKEPGYDDGAWARGAGVLGYGEDYIRTTLSYGPDPDEKHPTAYFRKPFGLSNASGITRLALNVMYDDGVVIYLNGTEIARASLPSGAVTFRTRASSHEAQGRYESFVVDPFAGLLREGLNLLAAEVHQRGAGSSDLVFDLELIAEGSGRAASESNGESGMSGSRFSAFVETADLAVRPVPYRGGGLTVSIRTGQPRDAATPVEVAVFDLSGRRVRTIVKGSFGGGVHTVRWDGRVGDGSRLEAGVYLVRATIGPQRLTRKLVVAR